MSEPVNNTLPDGHPVKTYFQENDLIHHLIEELKATDINLDSQRFYNIYNQLQTIEKRFARKENQLFPFLEKMGWHGPSKGMWSFHDTLREEMKIIRKSFEIKDYEGVMRDLPYLIDGIYNLMRIEETVLFPNALDMLSEADWKTMRKGEEEIGWMLAESPSAYPKEDYVHPSMDYEKRELSFSIENKEHYDEGYLSIEQVNLMFKTLPIDLTYVDENDKVIFYNRGEERVFPRSAGIIGREVKFCHPPKSVGTVLEILEKFKKGEQSEASFWINYKGRIIYIRYFAVRNSEKQYKGVIEMSQDITDIKTIEGEKRLLDWK